MLEKIEILKTKNFKKIENVKCQKIVVNLELNKVVVVKDKTSMDDETKEKKSEKMILKIYRENIVKESCDMDE